MTSFIISSRDATRCPSQILLPTHYRRDGSCLCDGRPGEPALPKALPWPRTVRGHLIYKTGPEGLVAWVVPSRSEPGAYRLVQSGREGAHGTFGLSCSCPRGRAYHQEHGHPWQTGPAVCWHVQVVLEAEAADGFARPEDAPVHPGLKAN